MAQYYVYKNNKYVVSRHAKMKTEAGWEAAVVYLDGTRAYVRELSDFENKFERIKNTKPSVEEVIHYGSFVLVDGTPLKENPGDLSYARFVLHMYDTPATLAIDIEKFVRKHRLYCDYNGQAYKVVGFSVLGDLWLADNFDRWDYSLRVDVNQCSNFRRGEK